MESREQLRDKAPSQQFDVCVIGGGATGSGCALDAQLRGLRTILLDAGDFGSAASSASTKLVHGGVRYLEQAVKTLDLQEYRMVRRALHERVHMLSNAPHLAHSAEFLIPVYSWWQAFYYRIGLRIYDAIAGSDNLFASHFLSREETLRQMPGLRDAGLHGACVYADGQFDDARYNMAMILSFLMEGGAALNYCRVTGFESDGSGKIRTAKAIDVQDGTDFPVSARVFVNATGAGSDSVRLLANPHIAKRLRPSKGIHIVLSRDAFPAEGALLVPKTEDGRVVFAVPWMGSLLVGTTDDEATPQTDLVVLRAEAEYLLRQLNPYLARPLRLEEIRSGFAGLRPLVAASGIHGTKELVREHEVEADSASGLISILGGKWTTYRCMAEDTINAVEQALGRPMTPTRTKEFLLSGANGYTNELWRELSAKYEISEATAKHLAGKFGTNAMEVLMFADGEPDLLAPLAPGFAPIAAEVVYCARREMARTVEDVLMRRTGLQLSDWRASIAAAPAAAQLLAREFGWAKEREAAAVREYSEKIKRFTATLGLPGERA